MKTVLAFCLLLLSLSTSASSLPLSSTFQIQPKDSDIRWNYIPALNAWRSEFKWQNENFNITVLRTEPVAFANEISVNKMWTEQKTEADAGMKILSDEKCHRQGRVHFSCERMVNENHEFLVNERLYWNEKSDLVLVRVSTSKNRDLLKKFADRLSTQIASRLPASKQKAVKQ